MSPSIRFLILLVFVLSSAPAWSDIYWVGSSTACTGSNVRSSLNDALLSAALNGGSDEIRLTNTLSYSGSDGKTTLTDWDPGAAGSLTISGGYSDCFTSPSGRTNFGDTTGTAVTVQTSSQPASNVTLRRLNIRSADSGLDATGGAEVFLDNVRIGDHGIRGIRVFGGAYVSVNASSIVEGNGSHPSGTSWGGGIYCNGTNSEVTISGRVHNNAAEYGGNVYLSNGCFVVLEGGAIIESQGNFAGGYAYYGGGVYVHNGGELFSNGDSQLVLIRNNSAQQGGAVYVNGSGRATLINTRIVGNAAVDGAAIYARNGGTSTPQLTMDRASSCPFVISCSEFEGSIAYRSVVEVENSYIRISRTLFDLNSVILTEDRKSLVHAHSGSIVRMGHVGLFRNTTSVALWNDSSILEAQHITIANNQQSLGGGSYGPAGALLLQGTSGGDTRIHNSIIADSTGVDLQGGSLSTLCLLLDGDSGDLPASFYHAGTPQFLNAGGGDFRQTSASPGVDMCNINSLFWSSTRDIEYQTLPVNDANNDQGNPGDAEGYYDAGFDENHMNVGEDYFTLTAALSGDGTGSVVSVPVGISCGSDCSEDYFNETLVELHAVAASGSAFSSWTGCPLPSGNICYISVEADTTITANFSLGSSADGIFADRFETAP